MRRDIFILNPAAGNTNKTAELSEFITSCVKDKGIDYKICITEYKGHAKEIVAAEAERDPHITCRFYACGGDGTLNEVVCGAAGHENAEVACYPCGTGNDFIKIFEDPKRFRVMDALISGDAIPFDLIRINDKYSLNLCSAGIDARVADWVGRHSHKVPLSGKMIYNLSLLVNFFGRIPRYYEVELDGKRLDGEYSIIVAASGRYYGGGFYAIPEAEPDDGLLDFLLVKKVSHIKLVGLIGHYQAGRHNDFEELQIYSRGRCLKLRSAEPQPINYDGEILSTREAIIELASHRLPIVVPTGTKLVRNALAKLRETAKA